MKTKAEIISVIEDLENDLIFFAGAFQGTGISEEDIEELKQEIQILKDFVYQTEGEV